MAAVTGTVYLLHFDSPFGHARHYTGFARDLDARLAKHASGNGARLMTAVAGAGITWRLARTWPGTRARERQLKRQGGASRRCPLCHQRRPRAQATELGARAASALADEAISPRRAISARGHAAVLRSLRRSGYAELGGRVVHALADEMTGPAAAIGARFHAASQRPLLAT